ATSTSEAVPLEYAPDSGAKCVSIRSSRLPTFSSCSRACASGTSRLSATLVGIARSTNGTPRRSASSDPTMLPPAPYEAERATRLMRVRYPLPAPATLGPGAGTDRRRAHSLERLAHPRPGVLALERSHDRAAGACRVGRGARRARAVHHRLG